MTLRVIRGLHPLARYSGRATVSRVKRQCEGEGGRETIKSSSFLSRPLPHAPSPTLSSFSSSLGRGITLLWSNTPTEIRLACLTRPGKLSRHRCHLPLPPGQQLPHLLV